VIVSQAAHSPAAGNAVIDVMLVGEIDVTNVPSLSRYLQRILDRSASGLSFDLTGVRFLDCAAAQAIVGTGRMLPDGQRPVLRHPRPVVRRLLSVTGLDAQCLVEPVDASFSGQRRDARRQRRPGALTPSSATEASGLTRPPLKKVVSRYFFAP